MFFTKDLEVGVPEIDSQHRKLIEHINNLVAKHAEAAKPAEIEKTLKMLDDYVVKHFGDEEKLQIKYAFPKYDWHIGQHAIYKKNLQELKNEYSTNGASARFALSLQQSIIDWIVRHIKSADVELSRHINSQ